MFGAIAGDVIGSVYERNNVKHKAFALFSEGSRFTDDSVLTLAVARALMSGEPPGRAMRELHGRYPQAGFGPTFRAWIAAGEGAPAPKSASNGAAMRISPVAWAFDTLAEVLAAAERFTVLTHDHPEGVKGARPRRRRCSWRRGESGDPPAYRTGLRLRPLGAAGRCGRVISTSRAGHGAASHPRLPRGRGFRGRSPTPFHRRRFDTLVASPGDRRGALGRRAGDYRGARVGGARRAVAHAGAALLRRLRGAARAVHAHNGERRHHLLAELDLARRIGGNSSLSAENGPPASTARSCEKALKPEEAVRVADAGVVDAAEGQVLRAYCCRHRLTVKLPELVSVRSFHRAGIAAPQVERERQARR